MRYIDSGDRDPSNAVATWLNDALTTDVAQLRCQSGFFSSESLGIFAPTLGRLASANAVVSAVLGSNDPGTSRDDVLDLVRLLGLPRSNANLGVVQYSNGFYHPKTYHLRYSNGRQCAYVGSANMTGQGIGSLHIEAGIILDSQEGDSNAVLDQIAAATDAWFQATREGMHIITNASDVERLVAEGVLQLAPPPRQPTSSGGTGTGRPRPPARLRPLVTLPGLPPPPVSPTTPPAAPQTAMNVLPPVVPQPGLVSVTRNGFPSDVLFAQNATGPTSGATAISGTALPRNAAGVIIRLTRDDTRVFGTGVGTANINLPVACMPTLRFGILGRGGYPNRPRAEFDLRARYIGTAGEVARVDDAETNVMLYGYMPGESGHQNRRMLLPADMRQLLDPINAAGLPVPTAGHLALLEWPTAANPEYRITFLDPNSSLGRQAQAIFTAAQGTADSLADNAALMMAGVAPAW